MALLDAAGKLVTARRRRVTPARERDVRVRSILVVEFWNIGDVVLALPFLAQLRAVFPGASVTLLGRRHAAELLDHSDLVDDVVVADFPWTSATHKYDPRRYDWYRLRALFRDLRARRFDVAFESRMDPRAKIVLALSGARRRVAYDYGGCEWLLTDPVTYGSLDRHRADDWNRLLEPFGGARTVPAPRLTVSRAEAAWAREWLTSQGIRRGEKIVAVHPGASNAAKRWPLDRFESVARHLVGLRGVRVVAIEEPGGFGARLSGMQGVSGIRPTLRQMLALFAEVDALVCNDSGPMHVAAAVGTPTVGVFHPHAAREFAPFGHGHRVLTPDVNPASRNVPPRAETLLGIGVGDVVAALEGVLSQAIPDKCATGS